MIQKEQGLESACVCPACFFSCNACMGTEQPPAALDELEFHAMLRQRMQEQENEPD